MPHFTKKFLQDEYWTKHKSLYKIASETAMSPNTIMRQMRKFGIPRRSLKEANPHARKGLRKWNLTEPQLKDLYWAQKLSLPKISRLLNIPYRTLWKYMERFGIPRRSHRESITKTVFHLPTNAFDTGLFVGLLIGEGSLAISKQANGKFLAARVRISNTDMEILQCLQSIIGGSIHKCGTPSNRCKQGYELQIRNLEHIYKLLSFLRPHMIGKKKQHTKILIEYCQRRLKVDCGPYTQKDFQLYRRIKSLNVRGRNA